MKDFYLKIKQKSPVRITALILLTLLIVILTNLNKISDKTLFSDILSLLLKATAFIIGAIFVFSLASVFIAWFRYKIKLKSKNTPPITNFNYTDNIVRCNVICENATRPLAGTTSASLNYINYNSPFHSLAPFNNRKKQIKGLAGVLVMNLPEIRNYDLESIAIRFKDIFSLFTFHVKQKAHGRCTVLPYSDFIKEIETLPVQSKDEVKRTDTVRRQPGEWIHFKSFEPSDDIRRIVWQVYARNKELVVRIPEMHNMYSSRIDVFASFYNFNTNNPTTINLNRYFLNEYKNKVWGVFKSFEENKELEVKFITDQVYPNSASPELSETLHKLTSMQWQNDTKPADYYKQGDVSIFCVSSLVPAEELEPVLAKVPPSVLITYMPVSNMAPGTPQNIVKEIFTIPDNVNGITAFKWFASPHRLRIINNENKIKKLFVKYGVNFLEI